MIPSFRCRKSDPTKIERSIYDLTGAAVDLTGATATIDLRKPDGVTAISFSAVVTVLGSKVSWLATSSDLNAVGLWSFEFKVTLQGASAPLTTPAESFQVDGTIA